MKEIRKQKKKKIEKKRKIEEGQGEPNRPRQETGPWPRKPSPEPVHPSSFSLTDRWDPPIISLPQPFPPPVTEPELAVTPPLQYALTPAISSSRPRL
jgi:hypothetical protein